MDLDSNSDLTKEILGWRVCLSMYFVVIVLYIQTHIYSVKAVAPSGDDLKCSTRAQQRRRRRTFSFSTDFFILFYFLFLFYARWLSNSTPTYLPIQFYIFGIRIVVYSLIVSGVWNILDWKLYKRKDIRYTGI